VLALIAAAAFLLASHFVPSSTGMRAALVTRLGERAYLGLYSVVALGAIVWLVAAWRRAPYVELWPTAGWLAVIPLLLMPVALIFLVGGVSGPNPTAVGAPDILGAPEPARGMVRITRHPVMWAIAVFALSHMVVNGDLASVIFFGSFAALALVGTTLIDRKYAARRGADWQRLAAITSNLPFAAIAAGRQRLVLAEIGWARFGAALLLYVVLLALHPWLFGASALGGLA
jgi:uncharacterized membrane protein